MSDDAERLRSIARQLLALADDMERNPRIITSRASTVQDIHCEGEDRKNVYNTLGYLARKGKIVRLGYGRYKLNSNPDGEMR